MAHQLPHTTDRASPSRPSHPFALDQLTSLSAGALAELHNELLHTKQAHPPLRRALRSEMREREGLGSALFRPTCLVAAGNQVYLHQGDGDGLAVATVAAIWPAGDGRRRLVWQQGTPRSQLYPAAHVWVLARLQPRVFTVVGRLDRIRCIFDVAGVVAGEHELVDDEVDAARQAVAVRALSPLHAERLAGQRLATQFGW